MCKVKKCMNLVSIQLKKSIDMRKNKMVFLLLGIYFYELCEGLVDFSKVVSTKATPFAYVHIVNDYRCQILIMACAIVLFCNAPFKDESHYYMVSRIGIRMWNIGQVVYMGIVSLIYNIYLLLICTIPFIFYGKWENAWSKIWTTMGMRDVTSLYHGGIEVNPWILNSYTPMQAILKTLFFEWICVFLIGMIIYFFNNSNFAH